ncbi:hypothetical protein GCM10010909_16140 [Acidocella aquatica]|uniref:Uncharacterized protein n=1 Tax=Acidocella aquatica TaxID=1922313 RepID=A0ABQ6A450_9PROT|nr:hypothetical protein GCM10010909_16140 [Acidocella aquatica]
MRHKATNPTSLEVQLAQAGGVANGDQHGAAPLSGPRHQSAAPSVDQAFMNLARLLGRQTAREAARNNAAAADHLQNDR